MQYEPIKRTLGRFFARTPLLRKTLYFLLDILLLRTWHVKKALHKIASQFPGDARILDAGSGFGQYSWRMSHMNDHWNIKAYDINKEQVDDCNIFIGKTGLSQRVSFYACNLTAMNDINCFDIILSVDVMEHIEEDVLVFRNFYKSLNNNGVLLISTPSDQGGSDVHNDHEKSFIDEHVRDGYSIKNITDKLSLAGFKSIEAGYTYGKPGNISWRLSMKYPIKMLNISYLFFLILPFYYLIIFPFALILNVADLMMKHETGTGLLVTARKLDQ